MSAGQSILFLLAGIGIFIFSLKLIEEALRNFASRSFKLFLRRTTTNKVYTVLGSAVITALVQGSSVVMIMVLALVGAGVLPMSAALAVMLGANLGTTLDSWVVASLGFKVSVDAFAYPAIVLATFLNLFVSRERWKHFADFLFGFGFLFISINMMKMSVSDWVTGIDLSLFNDTPLWQFVFLGILVTALVQSSLATMTIVLSALHAGAIQFDVAAAIVLGSEVGTTLKILIGAMDGYAPKKRLALGNFMVNSFTALVGFVFLHPLLYLVSHGLNVKDPLVGLVTFQSIINLLSVVVFLPVLNPLSLFLSKFFKEEDTLVTSFVKKEDLAEPGTAFDLFRKEAEFFMYSAMSFNLHLFGLKSRIADMKPQLADLEHRRKLFEKSQEEQYEFLKRLQGELQLYYLSLRSVLQQADQVHRLEHLIAAVRSAMHAAKSVMDITPNIENLRNSSKEEKYSFYIGARQYVADMYAKLEVMFQREGEVTFDELKLVHDEISAHYSHSLEIMYLNAAGGSLSNADFTTIMNLNRELFTSHKAMLMSVKDFRLEPAEAERFSELPVYLT